jgi:hypothetical protein
MFLSLLGLNILLDILFSEPSFSRIVYVFQDKKIYWSRDKILDPLSNGSEFDTGSLMTPHFYIN